jgi:hypothetical protein
MIDPFYEQTEVLAREDIADGVAYMVTPRATVASASYGPCAQNSSDPIRAPGAFSSDGGSPSGNGDRACGRDAPAPGANLSIADP